MLRIQFLPDLFIDNSYLVCVKVCVCKSTQNDRTVRRSEFDAWRHSKLSNHWLARASCPPNLPRYSFAALRWQSVISYSNSSTTRAVWACCICRGLRFHVCFLLQVVSTMFGQYLCSKLSDCDCIRLHLLCVFHGTWSKLLFIVIFSAMQQFCSTTRAVWACCICRGLRFHVCFLLQVVSTIFGQYLCSKLSDCDCIRLHLLCVFHVTWSKLLFIVIFPAMQQFCTISAWGTHHLDGGKLHILALVQKVRDAGMPLHAGWFKSLIWLRSSTKYVIRQKHAQTHRENTIKTSEKLLTSSKLLMLLNFQGMEHIFGCGSKDVTGLETFVLMWFVCASVGFRRNGVNFQEKRVCVCCCFCACSCMNWFHFSS